MSRRAKGPVATATDPVWTDSPVNQISGGARKPVRDVKWILEEASTSSSRTEVQRKHGRKAKIKKTCLKCSFKSWARNYCESSTLHGFRYLTEKGRPVWEKIMWSSTILFMIVSGAVVIFEQLQQFLRSPTLISFEPEQTPITTIPFPAVTICPQSQLKQSTFNMSWAVANRDNLTGEQEELYNFLVGWCGIHNFQFKKIVYSAEYVRLIADSINSHKSCKIFFPLLLWAGYALIDACETAQPLTTEFGACVAFNMMPIDQIIKNPNLTLVADSWADKYKGREQIWSPDTGYIQNTNDVPIDSRTPPWSPADGGLFNELLFLMKTPLSEYDPLCSLGGRGFMGFIHNPAELPGPGHSIFFANEGRLLYVRVTPKLYSLVDRLKNWPPQERGCFLENERTLRFFNVYTQRNCEMECSVNFSTSVCGCSLHYHPRFPDTPVCGGALKLHCIKLAKEIVSCDCKPPCSELDYQITTSFTIRRDWSSYVINSPLNDTHSASTMLSVRFHGRYVQGIRRDVMFSRSDFIASAGGLFGLFLGFSLISLVELIYFLTMRLWTTRKDQAFSHCKHIK